MKSWCEVTIAACAALCAFLSGSAAEAKATYTTFDAGGTSTFVTGINAANTVTGFSSGSRGSFVRTADGTVTTFDVGGAITLAVDINDAGNIAGYYFDDTGEHGFMRSADGSITTFDVPRGESTEPRAINGKGGITGCYDLCQHAFVRNVRGKISKFDIPNLDLVYDINNADAVVGIYGAFNSGFHGFLRTRDGTVSSIDVPGAHDTYATAINNTGSITGHYQDANGTGHGFMRAPDGTITTFDAPDCVVSPLSITDEGLIAGPCWTGKKEEHKSIGFTRAPNGTITEFHVPGGTRTNPAGINGTGAIAGDYRDRGSHVYRGFLRIP